MSDEEEFEPILVLGGVHHGQMVDDVGTLWQPMVLVSDPNNPMAQSVAVPFNYFRRWMIGKADGGQKLRRPVYAHETIQNPTQLMQALTAVLIHTWLEDGGEVVEEEEEEGLIGPVADSPKMVSDRAREGTTPMGGEPPRSASGLYLP